MESVENVKERGVNKDEILKKAALCLSCPHNPRNKKTESAE